MGGKGSDGDASPIGAVFSSSSTGRGERRLELGARTELFMRKKQHIDFFQLALNELLLATQERLIDGIRQDRAQYLTAQLQDVSVSIDGHLPTREWTALDRALRFGVNPPKKALAFPDALDDQGQAATTQEKVSGIAQKFFANVEAAQITSLDML
eukprot:1742062-Pyramimonas_sp.AAC.1